MMMMMMMMTMMMRIIIIMNVYLQIYDKVKRRCTYHVLVIAKSYSCPACFSTQVKLHRITYFLICHQKVTVVTRRAGFWNPKAPDSWCCCCGVLHYRKWQHAGDILM